LACASLQQTDAPDLAHRQCAQTAAASFPSAATMLAPATKGTVNIVKEINAIHSLFCLTLDQINSTSTDFIG
jgi:hypothetical protein